VKKKRQSVCGSNPVKGRKATDYFLVAASREYHVGVAGGKSASLKLENEEGEILKKDLSKKGEKPKGALRK